MEGSRQADRWWWILMVLLMMLWMFCLVYKARALLGLSLGAMGALALYDTRGEWWQRYQGYFASPSYWLPVLLLLGYSLSWLWTSNPGFIGKHMGLAAQAIGIPMLFYFLRHRFQPLLPWIWLGFAVLTALASLAVLCYLGFQADALEMALGRGRAIPTPYNHVRFAMAISIAALASIWLAVEGYRWNEASDRAQQAWLSGLPFRAVAFVSAVLLIMAVHLLAIRTAWLVFYAGAAVLLLRLGLPRVGWKGLLTLAVAAVLVIVLLVRTVPLLEMKWAYVRYDFERWVKAEEIEHSDAGRWASIQTSLDIVKEEPFWGASREGLPAAMQKGYTEAGFDNSALLPHNQWLFSWSAAGLLGLLGLLGFAAAPFFSPKWWQRPMLAESWLAFFILSLVDAPLQSDVGISLVLMAMCLGLYAQRPASDPTDPKAILPGSNPASAACRCIDYVHRRAPRG